MLFPLVRATVQILQEAESPLDHIIDGQACPVTVDSLDGLLNYKDYVKVFVKQHPSLDFVLELLRSERKPGMSRHACYVIIFA
jgi:hypothetical protein